MNLKWTHLGTSVLDGISSKMERFCDIGHCLRPQDRAAFPSASEQLPAVAADTAILSLDVEAQANHPTHLLEPGIYEMSLMISATNHLPIYKLLEIDVTGDWSDDLDRMVNDGIRIRLK
jgi:hypothetical protein